MKRPLRVVDHLGAPPPRPPSIVRLAGRLVSVVDTGDGASGDRFVDALVGVGAVRVDGAVDVNPDMRVVIRGTPQSPQASMRAEVLEETADVVLGSARPAFATHFGSACAHWVNG